jgi:hypothetical protein
MIETQLDMQRVGWQLAKKERGRSSFLWITTGANSASDASRITSHYSNSASDVSRIPAQDHLDRDLGVDTARCAP